MATDPALDQPPPDLLARLGRGLKRVRGANEKPDAKGFRTVWHHGPMKTDLFSYRGPDKRLVRQELILLGSAVSWDGGAGGGLSTGRVSGDAPAEPASATVSYGLSVADPRLLVQAALVLREAAPDYYVAHLLSRLGEALSRAGEPRAGFPGLSELEQEELRRLMATHASNPFLPVMSTELPPVPARRRPWMAPLWLLALALLGGLVAWLLGRT